MKSSTPSIDQLKRAIKIAEQIQSLEAELVSILGQKPAAALTSTRGTVKVSDGKRTYNFSPETLAKRAAAKENSEAKAEEKSSRKGKMSDKGRASIVAAQRARWAKQKQESEAGSAAPEAVKAKKSKKA